MRLGSDAGDEATCYSCRNASKKVSISMNDGMWRKEQKECGKNVHGGGTFR